jgi:competence ComEA-like helix-hairpin-helix protein
VLSTIKEQKQIDEGNTPESKKEYNYFDHFKEEKQGKAFEDIVTEKIKHGGRNENNFRHPSYNKIIVELNEAQSVDLIKLAGIGEVYSDRIIKYRDLLGGFYSVRQLTEVYGLDSSIIEKNQGNIALEKSEIEQLDINQVGFAELIRHPYLQKYNVNAILSYRRYKKNIKSINELKENGILPDSVFNKMAPYLSCE